MNFAVNYSHQAAALLYDGQIEIDYFKCAAWQGMIAAAQELRPVYVHFPLVVGQGNGNAMDNETNQAADWHKIEKLLAQTRTPFVNVHLAPKAKDYPNIPANTIDPSHVEMVTERVIRDVRAVVERFGADRVIIENDNSSGGKLLQYAALPEVICRVVNETNCGFLLDVSHARLAANKLNMNARNYISALPIARTREIHITGLQHFEGEWLSLAQQAGIDTETIQSFSGRLVDHLPMTDEDWEFAKGFTDQARGDNWGHPWITAFEYGGVGWLFGAVTKKDVLLDQVPRLYKLFKQLQSETIQP